MMITVITRLTCQEKKTHSLIIKLYGAVERGDIFLCAFGQAWFNEHACWLELSVGVVILFV
jgi:hypothetical protein